MENNKISLQDFKNNKEQCPKDGNTIFLEYDTRDGIPDFIKCTYCRSVYVFNDKEQAYLLRSAILKANA